MSENLLEVESDIPEEEAPPARAERPEGVPEKCALRGSYS